MRNRKSGERKACRTAWWSSPAVRARATPFRRVHLHPTEASAGCTVVRAVVAADDHRPDRPPTGLYASSSSCQLLIRSNVIGEKHYFIAEKSVLKGDCVSKQEAKAWTKTIHRVFLNYAIHSVDYTFFYLALKRQNFRLKFKFRLDHPIRIK